MEYDCDGFCVQGIHEGYAGSVDEVVAFASEVLLSHLGDAEDQLRLRISWF